MFVVYVFCLFVSGKYGITTRMVHCSVAVVMSTSAAQTVFFGDGSYFGSYFLRVSHNTTAENKVVLRIREC
jgi:hypothetical protein